MSDFDFSEGVGDWTADAGRGDDLYLSPEDVAVPDGVPEPQLWRLLVMPIQPRTKSKGGIYMPEAAREAEAHLNYIGKVVKLGPLAGKSEKFRNTEQAPPLDAMKVLYDGLLDGSDWDGIEKKLARSNGEPRSLWNVKEGDWIIFGRYAGQKCTFKDVQFLFINDDEVLGVAKSPDGFRIYT